LITISLAILATGLSLTEIGSINIILVSTPTQSNGISLAMTVLLYLIGTSVGPVIAGIFMQMYQTTIQGIVGSFAASQSYNLIFITAILMSMVFIVLFTIIIKMTAKSRGRSITNTF
jgi:MFS family permease